MKRDPGQRAIVSVCGAPEQRAPLLIWAIEAPWVGILQSLVWLQYSGLCDWEGSNGVVVEYTIAYVDKPEWKAIGQAIRDHNREQAGDDHAQTLCFVLSAPDQEIVGGVIGATYWNWLHIDLMWVKEELRGQGYGHRLLTLAEEEARQRGAKRAYLDTFSFQAPEFYRKHGYKVFGELEDFPPGYRRFFLAKRL